MAQSGGIGHSVFGFSYTLFSVKVMKRRKGSLISDKSTMCCELGIRTSYTIVKFDQHKKLRNFLLNTGYI